MVRSNSADTIHKVTEEAFCSLLEASTNSDDGSFPLASLERLSKSLRGIGPATASLVLSLAPTGPFRGAPFFSDELYLWLCQDSIYSSGHSNQQTVQREKTGKTNVKNTLKYSMQEYQHLWNSVRSLQRRISKGEEGNRYQGFSVLDIERIAFVIGHLDQVKDFSEATKIATPPDNENQDGPLAQNKTSGKKGTVKRPRNHATDTRKDINDNHIKKPKTRRES